MPIYEYECQKCGHQIEVMQKMSDAPLTKCPACKGRLEKQFSQTSFQLKGAGWYVSDYGKNGKSAKKEPGKEQGKEKEPAASPAPV